MVDSAGSAGPDTCAAVVHFPLCQSSGYGSSDNAQLVCRGNPEDLSVKIFKWLILISLLCALPLFLIKLIRRTGTSDDHDMRYDIDDYVAEEL